MTRGSRALLPDTNAPLMSVVGQNDLNLQSSESIGAQARHGGLGGGSRGVGILSLLYRPAHAGGIMSHAS